MRSALKYRGEEMATVKEFEDLIVWQKARVLSKKVFEASETGKFARDYKFVNQINDACDSIMSNIAEGMERDGHKELYQFLSYAKGSAGEVRSHLYTAIDRNYIMQKEFEQFYDNCKEISRMLSSFMRYIWETGRKGRKYRKPEKETGD
jgi:four helix bundle protein